MDKLFQAVQNNNLALVKREINKGIDPNQQHELGFTPLMWAILFNNDVKIIDLLLQIGVDVNAQYQHGSQLTAIIDFNLSFEEVWEHNYVNTYSVGVNEAECKIIRGLRARYEFVKDLEKRLGFNVLMLASYFHNLSAVQCLLQKTEIDVRMVDGYGNTALMYLAQSPLQTEDGLILVGLLLHYGVPFDLLNHHGEIFSEHILNTQKELYKAISAIDNFVEESDKCLRRDKVKKCMKVNQVIVNAHGTKQEKFFAFTKDCDMLAFLHKVLIEQSLVYNDALGVITALKGGEKLYLSHLLQGTLTISNQKMWKILLQNSDIKNEVLSNLSNTLSVLKRGSNVETITFSEGFLYKFFALCCMVYHLGGKRDKIQINHGLRNLKESAKELLLNYLNEEEFYSNIIQGDNSSAFLQDIHEISCTLDANSRVSCISTQMIISNLSSLINMGKCF